MFRLLSLSLVILIGSTFPPAQAADSVDELLQQARAALQQRDVVKALTLADRAVAADPKHARSRLFRGSLHEALQHHKEAIADFDAALKIDPKLAEAFDRRGSERFKLGQITESIEDFDRFLALEPARTPWHWKRGISYYYAGKYDEGTKQFEGYQTVDDNDVENAVWRFLCMARKVGVEKARADLLKIKDDRRVPMMQVYALFKGDLQPKDVLAAAESGSPSKEQLNQRLFYAHLYLGLFHEAAGDRDRAKEHITRAVTHKIDHYMWDVARVHQELLQKQR